MLASTSDENAYDADENESEETLFREMQAISLKALTECWDNEEDAVYDTLDVAPPPRNVNDCDT